MGRSLDMALGVIRQAFGDKDAWRASIGRFEAEDRAFPPAPGAVVFVGGSSFTFWSTMVRDLAPVPVINRGFGGATMDDVLRYADRIIVPCRPHAVVLFAGANDIVGPRAKSPEQVAASFRDLVARVRQSLPDVLIYYVAITPTPAGWKWWPLARETNRLISESVAADPGLRFIDLTDLLLGPDGLPDASLYGKNRHMNRQGYERWTSRIKPMLEQDLHHHGRVE